jgi:hypothetical protein
MVMAVAVAVFGSNRAFLANPVLLASFLAGLHQDDHGSNL